jgi:predicted RNase H-like nuclease
VTELAQRDRRFREVHPEVSFRAMNESRPLGCRKKSAGGALLRADLLQKAGIDLTGLKDAAHAPLDDVLDAAAAAWAAQRIATGAAQSLPDPPEEIDGYPVAIWY